MPLPSGHHDHKAALTIVTSFLTQNHSFRELKQRSFQCVELLGKYPPQQSTNQLVVCMQVPFIKVLILLDLLVI
jgi:hypothetical protein